MFKCDKLKATDVSVGVYQKKKRKNGQETKKKSSKLKKSDLKVALFLYKVKSIEAFLLGRISYFKWNCREISLMLGGIQLIPIP